MRKTAVFTADGRLNSKAHRAADCKAAIASAPAAYKTISTKEALCFEYISSFLGQFAALYPKRKLPYMLAKNEYGVQKFVCMTIRPSQVPFQELYDLYECASFLAGYILYEPLDPVTEPPELLFSPTQSLDSHTGDSFDMATVLCSFLAGAGFDCYVVNGYAPRYVTLRDQSSLPCPVIAGSTSTSSSSSSSASSSHQQHQQQNAGGEDDAPEGSAEGVYQPIDNEAKISVFIRQQEEAREAAKTDNFTLWTERPGPGRAEESPLDKRAHAWVLVRAGHRDVKEHCFLEPSTGRVYSTRNSPYIGIEAVWSHKNYFVNMQGFNGAKRVPELSFDLADADKWEPLFAASAVRAKEASDGADAAAGAADDASGSSPVDIARLFDCPVTWANPLKMDRQRYLVRFPPTGKRTVQYSKSKASFFARGVNRQSMTTRVVEYLDAECTLVKEIHELFEHRQDKLYKRSRYLLNGNYYVEHYHPGSAGDVKTWTCRPGKAIDVDFYVDGRLDRMYRREELIGHKITELFDQRGDCLETRIAYITPDKAVAGARQFSLPGQGLAPELYILKMICKFGRDEASSETKNGSTLPSSGAPTLPPAGANLGPPIAKRVFFVREGKLISSYHFAGGKITGKVQTFLHTRGPSIPVLTDQALAQQLGLEEDPALLQEAAALERECFASVKLAVQSFDAVVQSRLESELKEHQTVERSVFDTALDAVQAQDLKDRQMASLGLGPGTDVSVVSMATGGNATLNSGMSASSNANPSRDDDKQSTRIDYLAPFLRNIKDPLAITREEALEVRQVCLDSYKARLVERANIIQFRLNEENAKLARKQEQFQRSQKEGDMSTDEYEKYCTEAMFRIQILEQRLAAHEEDSLKKFAELDIRLANDVRLRVLKSSER